MVPIAAAVSAAAMPIASDTRPPSSKPQQHVATQFVGAEWVRQRGIGIAGQQIDRARIAVQGRRHQRHRQGGDRDNAQDKKRQLHRNATRGSSQA